MKSQPEFTLLFALKMTSGAMELVEALQKNTYTIKLAQTGEEAISIYNTMGNIDLIIISSDLQGKDAFLTVDEIRMINTSIPVILLSDFVTVSTIRLALGTGCNEILQTPLSVITLDKILHKYLDN